MSQLRHGDPEAIHDFRRNTDKNGPQMLGVTNTPHRALCIRCKKMRTEVTGQYRQAGFVCHQCGKGKA
jgi:hypothetical protein